MIFLRFLDAAYALTVNCDEMDEDKPTQSANRKKLL